MAVTGPRRPGAGEPGEPSGPGGRDGRDGGGPAAHRPAVRRGLGGFLDGIGAFLLGVRWLAGRPRWWLFGLLPALLTAVLYAVALVVLGFWVDDLAAVLTPFADGWSGAWRGVLRAFLAVMLFAAGAMLAVVTFTAVALLLGDPFYQRLSEEIDRDLGGLPRLPDEPLLRSLLRSAADSLVTLGYLLALTIPLFLLGFVPVLGQTVVPVLSALVAGFFLTVELTVSAMERRGLRRRERFAVLRAHLAPALGYGLTGFLIFLIPLGAVLAMPAAVCGAVVLVRRLPLPEVPPASGGGPRSS